MSQTWVGRDGTNLRYMSVLLADVRLQVFGLVGHCLARESQSIQRCIVPRLGHQRWVIEAKVLRWRYAKIVRVSDTVHRTILNQSI